MTEELDEIWENIVKVKAVYCSVCGQSEDMTNGMCPDPMTNHSMRACPARRAANKIRRKIRM